VGVKTNIVDISRISGFITGFRDKPVITSLAWKIFVCYHCTVQIISDISTSHVWLFCWQMELATIVAWASASLARCCSGL